MAWKNIKKNAISYDPQVAEASAEVLPRQVRNTMRFGQKTVRCRGRVREVMQVSQARARHNGGICGKTKKLPR